jgi:DNA polymerase III subunit delta'
MVTGAATALLLPWLQPALEQALRQRAHALLIHGPSGVGQFELAAALAQALLCEAAAAARPCGQCHGCHLMRARGHPDFCLLVPEAMRESLGWASDAETARDSGDSAKARAKPSREIRVEAVREAIGWAHKTATRGGAKVMLIHPAQAMNRVTANALLKTLEEPPGALRLLLCTSDPELLLPTIRSRCQRLPVAPPARDVALAWLEQQGIDGAAELLSAAGGYPLEASALAAQGISADLWRRVPALVRQGDVSAIAGWPVPLAVQTLQKLCHDLMAVAAGATPRYFAADALPGGASIAALAAWAAALARVSRHDEHPWNPTLLAESLVLQGSAVWAAARQAGFAQRDGARADAAARERQAPGPAGRFDTLGGP